MLILTISKYLDELFQDCRLASITSLRESCRIMVVAVNLSIVLVITILRAENCWTYRTSEMVDMVFALESCDV